MIILFGILAALVGIVVFAVAIKIAKFILGIVYYVGAFGILLLVVVVFFKLY